VAGTDPARHAGTRHLPGRHQPSHAERKFIVSQLYRPEGPQVGAGQAVGGYAPAQSRYVLPSFIERTSYGVKESNPYNKMFEERIIFLGVQIDDASANDVMAQLLVLESTDPDRDITMYINSPGGSFTALMAIYDTMQFIRPHVSTVCLGQAASAAAVLLAAGTPGKRMAVPNARILIHQPATEGFYGQVSDLEIQATEIGRMRKLLESTLAKHSHQDEAQIRHDIERDKILTSEQAVEYGLIDGITKTRKLPVSST
jgi:ATP-dependent Clp protease protease subunit